MSEVLSEVLNIFESVLCPQWIFNPNEDEKLTMATCFFQKYAIPGVVGCIDGTHVNIIAPSKNRHLYYNRKGNYSINVMLVCDSDMKIRCIDATHPGASHDALIWNVSHVRAGMEALYLSGQRNEWLLGDAGYPLEPWLMTSFRTPEPQSREMRFNEAHSKCRNTVERTIGVLKNRWRCLLAARQLHYSPSKAGKIVNVCAALHNICVHHRCNVEVPESSVRPVVSNDVIEARNERYATLARETRLRIAHSL